MSMATEILKENYTAYPNVLMRNHNNLLTKNERNLMIFLWDRLKGYKFPKNELSYSLILKDCNDFPKNNAKLSEAIKGLEKKGLLKVFRDYNNRNINKYYIGELQIKILQWYGRNFKGWKSGIIEPPQELTETEMENNNKTEPVEKTLYDEIIETEFEQQKFHNRFTNKREQYIEPLQPETNNEKTYLNQLTENDFLELYPDMDIFCFSFYRHQTIEQFKKTAERIRINKEKMEKQKQEEKNKPIEPTQEEPEIDFSEFTY